MAFSFRKFLSGINLEPKTSSTVSAQGDLDVDSTDGKLNYHNGTVASPVVTESSTATLTNKTINGSSNTISNVSLTTGVTGTLPVLNGGTGSSTQNFVDLTTAQTVAGTKTFSSNPTLSSMSTAGVVLNAAGGALSSTSGPLPIANGGTGETSASPTPTASTYAAWDTNSNLSANNHLEGYTTTATSGGTTTLTVSSSYFQRFTGSSNQTLVLPVGTTLVSGTQYSIINDSTGTVTVQNSAAATIVTMATGTTATVTLVSPSTPTWDYTYFQTNTGLPITNPMVNLGDMIYGGTSGVPTELVANTSSTLKVLTQTGTGTASAAPSWKSLATLGVVDKVNVQVFTSSGTYTPTTGMVYCTVEVVGSGAGGGGSAITSGSQVCFGGGGGAGEYIRKTYTASTIGSSQTVTINAAGAGGAAGANNGVAGGSVTFGSLLTAHGGLGGTGAPAVSTPAYAPGANGGAGGSGGSGDLDIPGGAGSFGVSLNVYGYSGKGGDSYFGRGGVPAMGIAAGSNGTGYGAGGSGGGSGESNTTGSAGGSGSNGICIVTEYISA